jgi:hypothetical protein
MLSQTAQNFNKYIANNLLLQAEIDQLKSPFELINLAQREGFELTVNDWQEIAQDAYQQWLNQLDQPLHDFFKIAHQNPELNDQIKQCQSVSKLIDLAQEYANLNLTKEQIKQAALIADHIPGFSFEKIWFRQLKNS